MGALPPARASVGFGSPRDTGLSSTGLESRDEDPPHPGNHSVLLWPPASSPGGGKERKMRRKLARNLLSGVDYSPGPSG